MQWVATQSCDCVVSSSTLTIDVHPSMHPLVVLYGEASSMSSTQLVNPMQTLERMRDAQLEASYCMMGCVDMSLDMPVLQG